MGKERRRRYYSEKTIKILFAQSGDECTYPGCTNPVVVPETEQSDAIVSIQICHIYASNVNPLRITPTTPIISWCRGGT